jgi:hypothetical protein
MPPTKYDDSSSPSSENDRVRESAALFDLPFDSLPADDGLSNLDAFRLGLRHALALLPAMLKTGRTDPDSEEEMERFSLD